MVDYEINYPGGDPDSIEWDMVEVKGWLGGVTVSSGQSTFRAAFYDETRHRQEVSETVAQSGFFIDPELVVLERVTRTNVEATIRALAERGFRDIAESAQPI